MRRIGVVAGVLLALAGAVWLAQGLNLPYAPASFMTGDRTWVLLGAISLAAGAAIAWWSWRAPGSSPGA